MEEDAESIQVKCPSCDATVDAIVKAEFNIMTYLTSAILIIFLQFWSLTILPFTIPLSRSISLLCPQCKSTIKKKPIFSKRSLNDQVISIQFGGFALIFSRRYLLYTLAIIYFLTFFFFSSADTALEISQIQWEDYLSDCSAEKIIKNKTEVSNIFSSKYYGKVVQWEGFLMKATVNQGWFTGEHAAVLLVKMKPSESEIYADVVLTFNQGDLEKSKKGIIEISRGDKFRFNATLVSVADEHSIHHLHVHGICKQEGFMDIPYEMKTHHRTSTVEIVQIKDSKKKVDHDHVHVYNSTYNSTLE